MQRRSLVIHTLLAVARQRAGLDEPRCRIVLELLSTAESVKAALRERLGISEGRFAALVSLFATDPSPISSAEIALHAGISRSAITDVLDRLEADKFIVRHRDTADRRIIYVNITPAGRTEVEAALKRFLEAAGHTADAVPAANFDVLHAAFAQFHPGATSSLSS